MGPHTTLRRLCSREEEKLAALLVLVREVIPAGRPTLIFASTRHHVDLLAQLLAAEGIPATFVYGTLDQARCPIARDAQLLWSASLACVLTW